ncbi:MAG: crossover junction endodeoxyribonuclease RuvC [Dehalococcoidales bacterium]|nr:crossover junction endodeoxyribonuclease RuvC [Dehalococcoidales bacterium]
MRVLGVDPGTLVLGYGVIDNEHGRVTMIDCGVITAPSRSPIGERLAYMYQHLLDIVSRQKPDVMAVEQPFLNKNVRAAIAIGQAQAIAILTASSNGIPVFEYPPASVKQSVAGCGTSSKEQVQIMVKLHLGLPAIPQSTDAADALAVALCHLNEAHVAGLLSRAKGN